MSLWGAKALPPDGDDGASAEPRRSRRLRRWVWREAALIGAIAIAALLVEWVSMVAEEVWSNRKGPGWAIPTTAAGVIEQPGARASRCPIESSVVVGGPTESASKERTTSGHVTLREKTTGEEVQPAPRAASRNTGVVQKQSDEADLVDELKPTWREK